MQFYSWKKGIKTGIYYLRRKAKHQAQQFTIEPEKNEDDSENISFSKYGIEGSGDANTCEMCSS